MVEELEFWSGNPQNVLSHGVIEIKQVEADFSKEALDGAVNTQFVCCPMIPSYLHVVEFCMLVEDRNKYSTIFSKKRDLSNLRVLKGPEPNIYVIAIKLTSVAAAKRFI